MEKTETLEEGGVVISECWPKKNLAKTGHPKKAKNIVPEAKKIHFFCIFKEKKGPTNFVG